MRPRFLFTVWPLSGHLHPNLAVAHALRQMGYDDIAFYTGASVRSLIENEGFRCFPFEAVDEDEVREIVNTLAVEQGHPFVRRALWGRWLIGTLGAQLADLERLAATWRPSVVICDPAMWAPMVVLHETWRMPVAVMSYASACMLPGPEGPVLGASVPKPSGPFSKLAISVLREAVGRFVAEGRVHVNKQRAAHGLRAIDTSITEFTGTMPLYLVPSSPEFDYARGDLPSSVHYVGPCIWDKPTRDAISAAQLPAGTLPLAYVSEGTVHRRNPKLLSAAIQGLRDEPLRVIVTTGRHRDPSQLGLPAAGANTTVEAWSALSDLLPSTKVVVTTGGSGTVMAALQAGVPLVIAPTDWDQPENAWRVAAAGAGIRLSARSCTPRGVRDAVRRVMSDPSFAFNAQRLGMTLKRCGGPVRAATLVAMLQPQRAERHEAESASTCQA